MQASLKSHCIRSCCKGTRATYFLLKPNCRALKWSLKLGKRRVFNRKKPCFGLLTRLSNAITRYCEFPLCFPSASSPQRATNTALKYTQTQWNGYTIPTAVDDPSFSCSIDFCLPSTQESAKCLFTFLCLSLLARKAQLFSIFSYLLSSNGSMEEADGTTDGKPEDGLPVGRHLYSNHHWFWEFF